MSDGLGILLKANNTGFIAAMQQAGTVTEREAKRMQSSLKFLESVTRDFKATQQAANDASNGIKEAAKHTEEFGFKTAGAKRELLVLAHELSQGNYSKFGGSLLVLGERTGAAALLFSGLGVSALAAAAAVAGFAIAVHTGATEAEDLRKSLVLTGNAAGVTSSSFNAMAANIAASTGSTVGSGKEALQALISTGRISQDVLGQAGQATLLMEKLTGKSADEIAKDFARMGDGVAKWAQEANKQYHFLSVSLFQQIKALDDQGKTAQASLIALDALNRHMGTVNETVMANAGYWARSKQALSEFIDKLKDLGAPATVDQQIKDLQAKLGTDAGREAFARTHNTAELARYDALEAKLRMQISLLQQAGNYESRNAGILSRKGVDDESAIKKIMDAKPAPEISLSAYNSVIQATQKYLSESAEMLSTGQKLSDVDKWRIGQLAELSKQTEGLTFLQRLNAQVGIQAAASMMQQAEANKKAADMEAEMQKLIGDRGLVTKKTDFDTEKQIAATKYLNSLPDDTKRAEALVNGSFSRMEDAILTFAKTGKLSFSSLWQFMSDEYLRNIIRMGEQKLLTDTAGNFIGLNGIFSGITSFFSGFGSHATGIDYVPSDNYLALLHKGERVQTAVQASSSNKGGANIDASINGLSVGAGVSLPQVHAAINQAVALSQAQMMRSLRQSGVAA